MYLHSAIALRTIFLLLRLFSGFLKGEKLLGEAKSPTIVALSVRLRFSAFLSK